MEEQLNRLKIILTEYLNCNDWTESAKEIQVHFTADTSKEEIDGLSWVNWAFKNSQESGIVIKEVFEKRFPNKELSILIGSSMGGTRDYVRVFGKTLSLEDILGHSKVLDKRSKFQENSKKLCTILREKIIQGNLLGLDKIILSRKDDMDEDEFLDEVSYVEWALSCGDEPIQQRGSLTMLDMIIIPLGREIIQKIPTFSGIDYSGKEGTIIIYFGDMP